MAEERTGTLNEARERILSLMRGGESEEAPPAAPPEEPQAEPVAEEAVEASAEPEAEQEAPKLSEEAARSEEHPSEEVDSQEAQDEHVSQFDELAEHLDVDLEYLYGLKVPVRVGDQSKALSISQLKDLAHKEYDLTKAEERLQRERQTLEAQRSEQAGAFSEGVAVAAGFIDRLEKQIEQDESNVDWRALREEDSAEYSALKQEFRDRRERLQKDKTELKSQWEAYQARAREEMESQRQRVLAAEQTALMERIPEWRDEQVRTAEGQRLANFLAGQGYRPEEIQGVQDSRAVKLARMAMLYEQGAQKTEVATKRVRKLPKRVKTSGGKPAPSVDSQKDKDLRSRLHKSGSMRDAAALLKHRMTRTS